MLSGGDRKKERNNPLQKGEAEDIIGPCSVGCNSPIRGRYYIGLRSDTRAPLTPYAGFALLLMDAALAAPPLRHLASCHHLCPVAAADSSDELYLPPFRDPRCRPYSCIDDVSPSYLYGLT